MGEASRRAALCLGFAVGNRPFEGSFLPGTAVHAEAVFYPSAAPLRALLGPPREKPRAFDQPAACADFEEAAERTAGWLAGDPWLDRAPWLVRDCLPGEREGFWCLRDAAGGVVPLAKQFANPWPLAAASGGVPVTVFGEWDGYSLLPLGVFAEGRFIDLGGKLP